MTEAADTAPVYPAVATQAGTYNGLNQLTNLSGQALTWDANGNLLSDGLRTYAWDAENRLIRITYPSEAGKQSDFAYDGRDRRTSITETPAGGGTAVAIRYLWCGGDICQARDTGNSVIRSYHADGEYLPGSPATTLFYGTDQLGSVRRVFTSTSVAPAFGYDPYGVPLQGTAPATDYGYAGMFRHGPSGLNLTRYRAYDPTPGRWLSRDPVGEGTDPAANLYAYVGGDPAANVDPTGQFLIALPAAAALESFTAGFLLGSVGSGLAVEIARDARIVGSGTWGYILIPPQIRLISTLFNKPPSDAYDEMGAKAPGKPGPETGFKDPPSGEQWVPNPNPGRDGSSHGWLDDKGRVWCPTGQGGRAHGKPHWDVQGSKGRYKNVRPGQNIDSISWN